jgi:hypothetical protein
MPVCIEMLKDRKFCITVREWAGVQINKKIKSVYNTKSNAIRAVRDERRNLVTLLCQLSYDTYSRVRDLEIKISNLKTKLNHVESGITDARSTNGGDFGSSGSNTVSCEGVEKSEDGVGESN